MFNYNKTMKSKTKSNKIIFWTPRILAILFIIFLTLFSLDVFQPGATAGEIVLGLLMHNIPSILLAILLAFAWKYEVVGAITFALMGIFYICFTLFRGSFQWYMLSWIATIALPAFLIAALFWLGWKQNIK